MARDLPWQLDMFRKGLKKNLRLQSLRRLLDDLAPDERCLLLTCGDNNGAMNYFLREIGGLVPTDPLVVFVEPAHQPRRPIAISRQEPDAELR